LHCSAAWLTVVVAVAPALPEAAARLDAARGGAWPAPEAWLLCVAAISAVILQSIPGHNKHAQHTPESLVH
jgi:hypothetical protein